MLVFMFMMAILSFLNIFPFNLLQAQSGNIKIAELGWNMPDFTLPAFQGGEVKINGLKGRNILLVFSRGKADSLHWCNICQYQYAELADLERTQKIREKYNLEILFVLPYDRETVKNWIETFPSQLEEIEGWKNPPDPAKLSEGEKKWMEKSRILYPKKFNITKSNIPTPFPILIDAERTISKGLDLFRTEWSQSRVDQNIPTIYIVDTKGSVQFKYTSQKTTDRPNADYLLKFVERMLL
jgi:peroxiredoxin